MLQNFALILGKLLHNAYRINSERMIDDKFFNYKNM